MEKEKEVVEQAFEEELRKTSESQNGGCKQCERLMSDMRKTAIRWLYLEWYKKSVLGLTLPNIFELTPTLNRVLLERQQSTKDCENCQTSFQEIIDCTLKPMSTLSDMYNGLSRTLSPTQSSGKFDVESTDNKTSQKDLGASSFFVRAAQKLNLSGKTSSVQRKESPKKKCEKLKRCTFPTNFSSLLLRNPVLAPPNLFKHGSLRKTDGHGKIRMLLRIVNRKNRPDTGTLITDMKKRQVSLHDPTSGGPSLGVAKVYSFDNIFNSATSQKTLCGSILTDLLINVVNGNDACLLTYGYPKLGKTKIMIGKDDSSDNIGLIPCAISWLYQLIEDRKQRTGARFSVRVSAVEIVGKSENLRDLLAEENHGSTCSNAKSPSLYLPNDRVSAIQLSDFTELRSPTGEKAAYYFDAAMASRVCSDFSEEGADVDERKNSNVIYTLHVYQYMIDKVGTGEIHGGRSRIHFIDLSGCSRKGRSRDTGQGTWLTLSALSNVITSLANGAKHIPHRNSKLTTLLREAMGSISTRITFIANISQDQKHYSETLSVLQLTTRIHRTRKKKSRYSSSSGGDSSCDEKRKYRRRCKPVTPMLITEACQSDTIGESELNSTSAADESCDTVIYMGPNGETLSDKDLTDFEHPPSLPYKGSHIEFEKSRTISETDQAYALGGNLHSKRNEKAVLPDEPIIVNISSHRHDLQSKQNDGSYNQSTHVNSRLTSIYDVCDLKKHEKSLSRNSVSANNSPVKEISNISDYDTYSKQHTLKYQTNLYNESLFNSNESLSSTATVENFERQLVTKIAERFALEDEFDNCKELDDLRTNETPQSIFNELDYQEFFIDDELENSIGAKLENNNMYFDSPFENLTKTDAQDRTPLDYMFSSSYLNFGETRCYDSADDTDERTDKEVRRFYRSGSSINSKDTIISPRRFSKHHLSEGVSSGYESMRCESTANICYEAAETNKRTQTVSRDNVSQYEQIKVLLRERQILNQELQMTLNRLVVNEIPLPRVDEYLQDFQVKEAENILSHENRILEQKVKVCKSHLQLVSTYDMNTKQSSKRNFIKSPFKKLSRKIRAKLRKYPTTEGNK